MLPETDNLLTAKWGYDPRARLTDFYRRAIASPHGRRGSVEQAGLYADALRGQKIADAVWAAWHENGVRPETHAIDITCADAKPEWREGVLPAKWAKQWPEGSRLVALFLFCENEFYPISEKMGRVRHFAEVCDVSGLGIDARCECSDFEARGFCAHCEAAILLAAKIAEKKGGA